MRASNSSAFRTIAVLLAATVSWSGCGEGPTVQGGRAPVASFTIDGGDDQISTAGQPLPVAPRVRVADAGGAGIAGMRVNFAITAGGGSLRTPVVETDAGGLAEAHWELGTTAGPQRLVAAVADPEAGASFGLEFSAIAVAGAPTKFRRVSGDGQLGGAGSRLSQPLVTRALDRYDNPVNGAEILWTVTSGGGALSSPSTPTGSDGTASVVWTLGPGVGESHSVAALLDTLPVLTFTAEAGLPSSWTTLASLPVAVRAAAAAAYDGHIYVVGGYGAHGLTDGLQIFDVGAGAWSAGADVPVAMNWSSAAFLDGRLHVVGGVTNGTAASDEHWIYDPELGSWSSGASLPFGTAGAAIATLDGTIYVFGGNDGPSAYAAHTQLYDGASGTWSIGADVPGPRITWAGAPLGGRILLAGGEEPGNRTLDELWSYDPAADAWSPLAAMPGVREAHGAAAIGSRLYVFGGRGGPSSVLSYDPGADRWDPAASPPVGLEETVAVALDGAVYALGGRSGGTALDVALRFDPEVQGGGGESR